jgi:hypothetical protein
METESSKYLQDSPLSYSANIPEQDPYQQEQSAYHLPDPAQFLIWSNASNNTETYASK